MNLMKYDVMTFGNHEFDLGSSAEGHQAFADFIKGQSSRLSVPMWTSPKMISSRDYSRT